MTSKSHVLVENVGDLLKALITPRARNSKAILSAIR